MIDCERVVEDYAHLFTYQAHVGINYCMEGLRFIEH